MPFIVQIAIAVGLTGWLSVRNGQRAVNDVASQLRRDVSQRIEERLDDFLAEPHLINRINHDLIALGHLDIRDQTALQRHFLQQLDSFPQIDAVFFGSATGEFFGSAYFDKKDPLLLVANSRRDQTLRFYSADAAGNPLGMVHAFPGYETTERPWYEVAVAANRLAWGDVFVYQTYPLMVLPAVRPIYDENSNLTGVLGTNFFLCRINAFLRDIEIGESGETFIVERSGLLIASSKTRRSFRVREGRTERLNYSDSRDPLIRSSAQFLQARYGDLQQIQQPMQLEFSLHGQRHFLEVVPFQDDWGLDWLIVVVVPEADFMAQIAANTRQTILLCFGSLLLATGSGILTARYLTQPILKLNQIAKDVSQGNLRQRSIRADGTREVNELAASFSQMMTQLQHSFEQLQALNQALAASESRLKQFLEALPVGVAVQDPSNRIIYMNQIGKQLMGFLEIPDADMEEFVAVYGVFNSETGKPYETGELPIVRALRGETHCVDNMEIHQPDRVVPLEVRATPIFDERQEVSYAIVAFQDISDRKQAEAKLIHSALHDALTDLPNRKLLIQRLELALGRLKRSEREQFAILFLDLDQFKRVNDSLGHFLGDRLLLAVAQKLQASLRTDDVLARLGGDEFVILLEGIQGLSDAIDVAERICAALRSPLTVTQNRIFITASIGIVLGTSNYNSASDLLRDADITMYRAKNSGRATYAVFDVEMHAQLLQRVNLENDLRQAIAAHQLVVHYQPIVEIATQRLVGFEALVRWPHPTRGMLSPDTFIPIAEETGLIVPLDLWLLETACQQLEAWRQQFPKHPDLRVTVNLSGRDLREPKLVEAIATTLTKTGLAPQFLTLEITESMLIENIEIVANLLASLRKQGIQISIDDFGTGYSSLNYLYRLPVDTLKIDRSFVSRMQTGSRNYKIVETIVALSDRLELKTIAEGIETECQFLWLRELGCEFGQGYWCSHPLPAPAAETLIARGILNP